MTGNDYYSFTGVTRYHCPCISATCGTVARYILVTGETRMRFESYFCSTMIFCDFGVMRKAAGTACRCLSEYAKHTLETHHNKCIHSTRRISLPLCKYTCTTPSLGLYDLNLLPSSINSVTIRDEPPHPPIHPRRATRRAQGVKLTAPLQHSTHTGIPSSSISRYFS